MNVKEKIKEILNRPNDSKITLFELEKNHPEFIEHFDDGDIDFNKFKEYNDSNKDLRCSFMITGGLNGIGIWKNYLSDLESIFKQLRNETGYDFTIHKIETDDIDDVWTAQVLGYDVRDNVTKDNICNKFKDVLDPVKRTENRLNKLAEKVIYITLGTDVDIPGKETRTRKEAINLTNNEILLDKEQVKVNLYGDKYTYVPFKDLGLTKENLSEDIKKLTKEKYRDMVEMAANRILLKDSVIKDVIRKMNSGYVIYSEKGKKLSKPYKTKEEAEKRLKEIEMFKHMNAKDSSYRGYDIEYKGDLYQIWKDTHDGDTKIAGDFSSIEEAEAWIDDYLDNPIKKKNSERLHKYDVYYVDAQTDDYTVEKDVVAHSPEEAKLKVKRRYGSMIYGNPHDAILKDSEKEIKDMNEMENAKRFLESLIVKKEDPDNKLGKTYIRALKNEESLPKGVKFRAATDNSGILQFHGLLFYYYLDNEDQIHIERHFHDSDKRFVCKSYYDDAGKGLDDVLETNNLSKAKEWINEKINDGFVTRLIDMETGEVLFMKDSEELNFDIPSAENEIELHIVQWYDDKGNKHTVEFDSKEDAEEFVELHKDEYKEIKIVKEFRKLTEDSVEEIDIELEGKLDELVEKGYHEYCKCAEKEPFEYSDKLIELLNQISKYTKTTETEIMQMYRELFEKETLKVQDSPLRVINSKNLKSRLIKIFTDYADKLGFDKEDITDWLVVDIKPFTNEDGDEGIHIQIRNEAIGFYEPDWTSQEQALLDKMIAELDKAVAPGYFEPYYNHVWDAYIFDVKLSDSVQDEVSDENDSNKLMDIVSQSKEILKRALIEEGFDDDEEIFEKAEIEVRHEKDGENDLIIVNGNPEWSGTILEEDVVNEILDLIESEYADFDNDKDFHWGSNSAGATFTIRSGK